MTPWPTTMCYPLREVSQTDGEREKRPGRGQKTVQLHLVRRERKKKKTDGRNERRCTHPVETAALSVKKTQKSRQSRLYQKDDNSAFVSLNYDHTVGSVSQMHKRFIQLLSIHSPRQSSLSSPHLTFSHTLAPRHPLQTPPNPHHSDLTPAVSHWSLWG